MLAVDRDVRIADLRVVLSLAIRAGDVEPDRARLRRIAVGHRLAGAHRARELGTTSRARVRTASCSGSSATTSTATATTTITASATHATHHFLTRRRPPTARPAATPRARPASTGPRLPHAATPLGRDHVGLGLTGGAEAEARAALRVERDRPVDLVGRDVRAHWRGSSSRTMPTIAKSGSLRCAA